MIVSPGQSCIVQTKDCFNNKNQPWNFNLDIDCPIINTLCSTYFIQEDGYYVDKLRDKFEETRSEISLGQEIVTEFIDFCKVKGKFSPAFWKGVSRQMRQGIMREKKYCFLDSSFRERYLSFVCSLDVIDEIPMTTMYNLFKTNLAKAEMLTYVFVFNARGWYEELDFVWGSTDLKQWNVSIILFFEIIFLNIPSSVTFDENNSVSKCY